MESEEIDTDISVNPFCKLEATVNYAKTEDRG